MSNVEQGDRFLIVEDIGHFRSEIFSIQTDTITKYVPTNIDFLKAVTIDDENNPGTQKVVYVENVYSHRIFINNAELSGTVGEQFGTVYRIVLPQEITSTDKVVYEITYTSQYDAVNLGSGTNYTFEEQAANITTAWKNADGTLFTAKANDIIECVAVDGSGSPTWQVIFSAEYAQKEQWMVWQTNIYTGVQYVWNGVQWAKSFEGEYRAGEWRVEL
jgi:hypothetical protein